MKSIFDILNAIQKKIIVFLILIIMIALNNKIFAQEADIIVRISEIEIDSVYLKEYLSILKEESSASVRLEKGVISIFPLYQKANPTQIRILEIYENKEAYESHLTTTHFQKYKQSTLKMVKSLRLVDMDLIDLQTMTIIFKKLDLKHNKD